MQKCGRGPAVQGPNRPVGHGSQPPAERPEPRTYRGIEYRLLPGVYPPAEDTFLLADAAAQAPPGGRVLEACCGSGLAAMAARQAGAHVVASDIDPTACRNARLNRLEAVRADLLSAFRGPFDLLLCNPPYLPSGEEERLAGMADIRLDGGPDGLDATRRLLAQSPAVLAPGGRLLLVASSMQGWERVEGLLSSGGWAFEVAGRSRAFFEELRAYLCRRDAVPRDALPHGIRSREGGT